MEKYDCTKDVNKHQDVVKHFMKEVWFDLLGRMNKHDKSKLESPEKGMFDIFTPKLKEFEFGSDEYKQALIDMGEALKHHYAFNRHHPEHFDNGIDGMNLLDLVEMVCDWQAAAYIKGNEIDMEYLSKRFDLSEQLSNVIRNTINHK